MFLQHDRIQRFGLSLKPGVDFEVVNPEDDPRYRDYVQTYLDIAGRRGITPETAWLLSQALNTTPEFWINLQAAYDLARCRPSEKVERLAAVC